jgi:hypothetical protein
VQNTPAGWRAPICGAGKFSLFDFCLTFRKNKWAKLWIEKNCFVKAAE